MAEDEKMVEGAANKPVTLAEAEAKLRAATTAQERVEAQKLVRMAQAEEEKAQAAVAASAAAATASAATASAVAATPAAPQKKSHVVQKGESLSLIAKQYYGDVHKWKELYEANKAVVGNNPDVIQPGMELVIP